MKKCKTFLFTQANVHRLGFVFVKAKRLEYTWKVLHVTKFIAMPRYNAVCNRAQKIDRLLQL